MQGNRGKGGKSVSGTDKSAAKKTSTKQGRKEKKLAKKAKQEKKHTQ